MPKILTDQSTSVNISSNVLFHFTNSIDNLLNILRHDFSPHYCLEYGTYDDILKNKDKKPPSYASPMVSFCDLPLFLIKKHLKFYGCYGIGLNKKWGIEKGVTPVLYVHQKSLVFKPLQDLTEQAMKDGLTFANPTLNRVLSLMAFVKPYEGPAWRSNQYFESVRFYDEREWRFVPRLSLNQKRLLKRDEYLDEKIKNEANSSIAQQFTLTCSPKDIQYIIVSKENEVLPMIRQIEVIKGKYSSDDVKILTTAIMTSDRIMEDF